MTIRTKTTTTLVLKATILLLILLNFDQPFPSTKTWMMLTYKCASNIYLEQYFAHLSNTKLGKLGLTNKFVATNLYFFKFLLDLHTYRYLKLLNCKPLILLSSKQIKKFYNKINKLIHHFLKKFLQCFVIMLTLTFGLPERSQNCLCF